MVTVTLKEVTKVFGEVKAVDNIDLEIQEDELFFLLGPSGCGKTTTLRIIAGFYKPEKGKVLFDDKVINDLPAYKRNIGMVFQNYALWPHMNCFENIVYGLKIRNMSKSEIDRKAEEALEMVQMGGYGSRYPNQLSGGQQQRIALARAIVTEPEVLLLDEPLSNLDAKLRIETRKEIKRIQRNIGITSIYVTHDQDEALSMADRIAVMNKGKIEQIDAAREIYNNHINSFVAGFIGETNLIEGTIEEIKEKNVSIRTLSGHFFDGVLKGNNFVKGQKVICSIRPEVIKIFDDDTKIDDNCQVFESTIISQAYYGLIENYLVRSFDVELKVSNVNPETSMLQEGSSLNICFLPENVDVFPLEVT
jgi:iron(III) transport system ATP-binding protein